MRVRVCQNKPHFIPLVNSSVPPASCPGAERDRAWLPPSSHELGTWAGLEAGITRAGGGGGQEAAAALPG